MRAIFFITLTALIAHDLSSQSMEEYYKYLKRSELAKKHHIKQIITKNYKNGKEKNEEILSMERYDSTGKLNIIIWLWSKRPDTISLYYNTNNELIKITESPKDYVGEVITDFKYRPDGKARFATRTEFSSADTVTAYFVYYKNERQNKIFTQGFFDYLDSIWFFYDDEGMIKHSSYNLFHVSDLRILDSSGCVCGYLIDSFDDFASQTVNDSHCNVLYWRELSKIKGKWIVTYEGNNIYQNDRIIESTGYERKKRIFVRFNRNLTYLYKTCYEYDNRGLLIKEISYNRRGKLTWVKRYFYQMY